ncbi:hypothetical protein TKK_0016705 [Trichogramma kaykai]|uniref:Uncharacterized protein n=1 Tax=Trichogramma kaykai TaxID=54128 RepID=A0ABD2XK37_9HYME
MVEDNAVSEYIEHIYEDYWEMEAPELEKLVKFVIASRYKDEGSDLWGLRTTLLHRVVKLNHPPLYRDELIRDLFKIYNEFKINCLDEETGLTNLHVACMSSLDDVVKEFLKHCQDPNCFVAAAEGLPLLLARSTGESRWQSGC